MLELQVKRQQLVRQQKEAADVAFDVDDLKRAHGFIIPSNPEKEARKLAAAKERDRLSGELSRLDSQIRQLELQIRG